MTKNVGRTADWFRPGNFFAIDSGHPLEGFFADIEGVWEALPLLKKMILARLKPNVEGLLKRGSLVSAPTALHQGEAIVDFAYRFDGEGRFVCSQGDHVLEGAALILPGAYLADEEIELSPGALVEPGAMIKGPTFIGPGTEVRQGAYVRGSVFALADCVIGHATEAKNTLMLTGAKAGHFAYLGDSLLGSNVNLGAGTKLANLKMLDAPHRFVVDGVETQVDLRKFGAIIGDKTETGCNSVTSPGVLMGPRSRLLPNITAKGGYFPPRSIIR
jgi:hypothetical protein